MPTQKCHRCGGTGRLGHWTDKFVTKDNVNICNVCLGKGCVKVDGKRSSK
jgi:hypothetical protein